MPRATAPSVRTAELPEFLRSRAVGAVIAERLHDQVQGEGAVTEMIAQAAREIREFHDLPEPDQRTDPHRFGIVSNETEHEAHG